MAKISGGELAEAVTRAGGLGIVAAGYGDRVWIREQVSLVNTRPFGIGVITWNMPVGFIGDILSFDPDAVWLSFGDPGPHIPAIHAAGAVAICQVGTVAEADDAVYAGADVVVAQGREAGGHGRLAVPLMELVADVATRHPSVPLVATGGLSGSEDLDRVAGAGAQGVALGTAFYATREAHDTDVAKRRLINARSSDTVVSRVYDHIRGPLWPEGYRGRSLRTRLTDEWAGAEEAMAGRIDEIRDNYAAAAAADDMDHRVVWAGTGVDTINAVRPATDIVTAFPTHAPR